MLHSGVPLVKAFPEAGHRLGDVRFRRTIEDVTRALKRGTDISAACEEHGDRQLNVRYEHSAEWAPIGQLTALSAH